MSKEKSDDKFLKNLKVKAVLGRCSKNCAKNNSLKISKNNDKKEKS